MRNAASKVMWAGRATAMFFVVLTLVVLGYATKAYAAPGDLDPSFDSDGKLTTDFGSGAPEAAYDLAVQQDGKIVVVGQTRTSTGGDDFALARYNENGTLDTSFGMRGKVTTPMAPGTNTDAARAVTLQPDGKIMVAGFASNGTDKDFAVARYNSNGTLDTTFSGDGKATAAPGAEAEDIANDVALQGTKIVVVGTVKTGGSINSIQDVAVVRFGSTGSLDTTFNSTGMVKTDLFGGADEANAVAVTGTKIVVAGSTFNPSNFEAGADFALVRYTDSGTLDKFGAGGKVVTHFGSGDDAAFDLAIQEDGKLVAAGSAQNSSNDDFAVARYNLAGSLDEEFDFDGKSTTDFGAYIDEAHSVAIQEDGKIVAAGYSASDFALARYNPDGTPNNTFHNDGKLKTNFANMMDTAYGLHVQEDGKLVAAGSAQNSSNGDFAVARYYGANDITAPRVSAPAQSLVAAAYGPDSTLGATAIPVRISWNASDSEGELARFQLQRSVDGGAYTNVIVPSVTMPGITVQLNPTSTYRFRVRATDDNGNTSFWKYGPRFTVDVYQENSSAITYSNGLQTSAGGWTQMFEGSAYGGAVKYSSTGDDIATLTFTGRNVAWVTSVDNRGGVAQISLDGTPVSYQQRGDAPPTGPDAPPTTYHRQMMYSANGLNPSVSHTLQLQVPLPSSWHSNTVVVDAFVVLR